MKFIHKIIQIEETIFKIIIMLQHDLQHQILRRKLLNTYN